MVGQNCAKFGLHFTQATLMSPVTCHLTTTLYDALASMTLLIKFVREGDIRQHQTDTTTVSSKSLLEKVLKTKLQGFFNNLED